MRKISICSQFQYLRMTNLDKEQTAAQIVALVRARFERPRLSDIEDILERSKLQARRIQEPE
jgi:hypothetical protein